MFSLESLQVQSIRSVGIRGGWFYSAWGVYEPRYSRRTGRVTWRLTRSGKWFTSDKRGWRAFDRGWRAFPGIRQVQRVRHGSPVAGLTGKEVARG